MLRSMGDSLKGFLKCPDSLLQQKDVIVVTGWTARRQWKFLRFSQYCSLGCSWKQIAITEGVCIQWNYDLMYVSGGASCGNYS
jgi:hypothetical protein